MKIAVVHEWLATYAGSERVLAQILQLYPQADLFSVCDFLPDNERHFLGGRKPTTTFIQKLPFAARRFRHYLSLMPLAIEQLDLSSYDLVISSHHAVAKGVITGADQLHVSYLHSPMRYAWELQHQYLNEARLEHGIRSAFARLMLHRLRAWDRHTSAGVDAYIANSRFIARRIRKTYRRDSHVIYPPVNVEAFTQRDDKEDFYLAASRMVPYKRMALIAEAFAQLPHLKLKIVGDGPDYARVRSLAGSNTEFLGYQSGHGLRDLMQRAKAFVFAAEEDFGITVVEAQACGTPVIAYGKGGALETIVGSWANHEGMAQEANAEPAIARTGLFFERQSADCLADAVRQFEKMPGGFSAAACANNAARFSEARFRSEFRELTDKLWEEFSATRR